MPSPAMPSRTERARRRRPMAGRAIVLTACAVISTASGQSVRVCVSPSAAIPDAGAPLSITLEPALPAGVTVLDATVELDIGHPWIGDLVVTLDHDGRQAVLVDRLTSDVFAFGCGGDDIVATFRDDAPITPDELCARGVVPNITGDVLPATALGVFAGASADGAWVLTVRDAAPFDAGVLRGVCLTVVHSPPAACSPADVTATGGSSGLPDGVVDLSDFSFYLSLWSGGDPRADVTPTGTCDVGLADAIVDLSDFSCYLSVWSEGCP